MCDTDEQEILADRRVVTTSPTYLAACELVDYLVSKDMPREKLTIAAEELRFRQEVAGGRGAGPNSARDALRSYDWFELRCSLRLILVD